MFQASPLFALVAVKSLAVPVEFAAHIDYSTTRVRGADIGVSGVTRTITTRAIAGGVSRIVVDRIDQICHRFANA